MKNETIIDRKRVGKEMENIKATAQALQGVVAKVYEVTGKDPSQENLIRFINSRDRENDFLRIISEMRSGIPGVRVEMPNDQEKELREFAVNWWGTLYSDLTYINIQDGRVTILPDTLQRLEALYQITPDPKQIEVATWCEKWISIMDERPKFLGWQGSVGLPLYVRDIGGRLQVDYDGLYSQA